MNYKNITNNTRERRFITYPFCYWDNAFSSEEIDRMCNHVIYDIGNVQDGTVFSQGESQSAQGRKSKVNFFHKNENTEWFFNKLNYYINELNNNYYNFDINGYDAIQYTEYHSSVLGKYDWHMDTFISDQIPENEIDTRKLSAIVLASEPGKDFTGGDFQLNIGSEQNPASILMHKGKLIIFPSFLIHRVTPVTQGIRKSFVVWVTGPKFR